MVKLVENAELAWAAFCYRPRALDTTVRVTSRNDNSFERRVVKSKHATVEKMV